MTKVSIRFCLYIAAFNFLSKSSGSSSQIFAQERAKLNNFYRAQFSKFSAEIHTLYTCKIRLQENISGIYDETIKDFIRIVIDTFFCHRISDSEDHPNR